MALTRRGFVHLSGGAVASALLPAFGRRSNQHSSQAPVRLTTPSRRFGAFFTDIAKEAGLIQPVIYGEPDHKDYILETVGCGCAFLDYDNDGWMDIFILNGSRLRGVPQDTTSRLYRNNRDGTFTDVTEKAALAASGWASAVCVGDYNNDGFEDLFCTFYGQNKLYRNNGDGTFTEVTKQAGLWNEQTRWGAGCSFVDYDRDGRLDLFVSNYVQFDFEHVPKPGANVNCTWKGVPVNCGPRGLTPGINSLYRNNGDGTFTDVSQQAGIAGARAGYGMTVVAADFNEDGWTDIYVACDSTPSLLFMNQHDGRFKEEGIARGVAFNDDGKEQAGMGLGVGDYNLDGHLDLFKTNFADDTNVLYENDGKANFEDKTYAAKLGTESQYISWGTDIVDLDNDGWPDIFFVSGSVYPELERQLSNYPDKCPRTILRNLGNASFEQVIEAGPGLASKHSSRGCAFGDFDNDGDVDILIVNLNEPPSLLRNDIQGNYHWLKVKLIGTKSNRSAIGARVLARYGGKVQARSVLSQSSFYSSNDPRLHFGLGFATSANLEIVWPNGNQESYASVPCDKLVAIREGSGIVSSEDPNKR
jgi:enediyne biosynthesis protein E4